jgi:hypothetical protein
LHVALHMGRARRCTRLANGREFQVFMRSSAQARRLQSTHGRRYVMRSLALAVAFSILVFPLAARAEDPPPPSQAQAPTAPTSASPVYNTPHIVPYEGGTIPRNAHLEDRTNMTLLGPGIGIAGAAYSLSVLYALGTCGAQMECRSGSAWLYVPVVGPFVTATQAPTSGGATLSVFDGAVQLIGASLLVAGIAMPKQVVVWQDDAVAVRVAPAPIAGGGGLSVNVTGY